MEYAPQEQLLRTHLSTLSVTDLGMQLEPHQSKTSKMEGSKRLLGCIDTIEAWKAQKAEASNAKYCVKDVYHIARSVCYAAFLRILMNSANFPRLQYQIDNRHTWQRNMNCDSFSRLIQCKRPIIERLLSTHQL